MKELPEGWEWKKLGEINLKINKINPKKEPDNAFKYIDIESIDNKVQKITQPKNYLGRDAPSRARQHIKKGDILFSTVRTYLKNISIVDEVYDGEIASTGFCVIRPSSEVDTKYIFFLTLTDNFLNKLDQLQSGSSYPAVRDRDIFAQFIPLPPLETQRQIVAILEKAEETKRLRVQADELTDQLIQSVFLEMFGDPVANPMGWDMKMIEEICDRITDGEHATPKRTDEGIYLLSARNIQNHKFDLDDVDFIGDDEYERISKRIIPQVDDVLISCSGTIGRVTRVKQHFKFQLVRSVALIRPITAIVDPTYLEYSFDTNLIKGQIDRAVNQSSQANLFQGKIKKLSIPLPPIHLQQQFAHFVERVELMRQNQAQSAQELDDLFNALMQKAFTGDLTT